MNITPWRKRNGGLAVENTIEDLWKDALEPYGFARGRWPGCTTLNGFIFGVSTKLCIRWLSPTPVEPAINAGIQPPLGVTETTQPSASAAWIEVVPARKLASLFISLAC